MPFCVSLKVKDLLIQSIRDKLSRFLSANKIFGYSENMGDFWLQKMFKEFISPEALSGIGAEWITLCSDTNKASLFHVAALVTFWGALKISELVASSHHYSSGLVLHFQNIMLLGCSASIMIQFSKTDQFQKGALSILGPCIDSALCPMEALHCYVAIRDSIKGNSFVQRDKTDKISVLDCDKM